MENTEKKSPKLTNATLIGPVNPDLFAELPYVNRDILPNFIKNGFDTIEYSYTFFLGNKDPKTITHKHIVFEVVDDTMKPRICQGDKVLGYFISKEELESIKEGMYILIVNDQLLMRRVRENTLGTNGSLMLYSNDDQVNPITVYLKDISAIWEAQGSNVSVN